MKCILFPYSTLYIQSGGFLILCKQFLVEYEIQQDKKCCSELVKTIIIIYFLCEVTVEKYEVKQLRAKVLQSCFLVTSFFAHISQQTFICPALFLSFSCKELSDMKRLIRLTKVHLSNTRIFSLLHQVSSLEHDMWGGELREWDFRLHH